MADEQLGLFGEAPAPAQVAKTARPRRQAKQAPSPAEVTTPAPAEAFFVTYAGRVERARALGPARPLPPGLGVAAAVELEGLGGVDAARVFDATPEGRAAAESYAKGPGPEGRV